MARRPRPPADWSDEQRAAWRSLQALPNIGPAMAQDLVRLGFRAPTELAGQESSRLYARLCELDGVRHDPCVEDVFEAAIRVAAGEPARPWWTFTALRKARRTVL